MKNYRIYYITSPILITQTKIISHIDSNHAISYFNSKYPNSTILGITESI